MWDRTVVRILNESGTANLTNATINTTLNASLNLTTEGKEAVETFTLSSLWPWFILLLLAFLLYYFITTRRRRRKWRG